MSRKNDRVAHGPGWTEVIIGAVLSVVLGVALAAILLMLRPVVVARELPKEADRDPRAVYYLEGSRDTGRAVQAAAKRQAFLGGQSVSLNEEEINALAAQASTRGAGGAKETPADDFLALGTPNVRISEGALQVGLPVTVNLLGVSQKVVVQARGGFVRDGDGFAYQPDVLYFGSCPVQQLPLLGGFVRKRLLAAQPIPDDIKAAWGKLAKVSIEGNVLKLTMP